MRWTTRGIGLGKAVGAACITARVPAFPPRAATREAGLVASAAMLRIGREIAAAPVLRAGRPALPAAAAAMATAGARAAAGAFPAFGADLLAGSQCVPAGPRQQGADSATSDSQHRPPRPGERKGSH